jgi:hypothetical protein
MCRTFLARPGDQDWVPTARASMINEKQARSIKYQLTIAKPPLSLRAGFLTSAAKRGANLLKMMDVSRHRSVDTLRGYVRDAELFKDHAGAGLL